MNQGTKLVLLMKKNRSQKSRASVPLSTKFWIPTHPNPAESCGSAEVHFEGPQQHICTFLKSSFP